MTKFKELCKCFALAAAGLLCLTLVEVALSVDAAVKTATEEIHSNAMQLRVVIGQASDVLTKVGNTADSLSGTAKAVTNTANEQNKAWKENARAMRILGDAGSKLILDTDFALNGSNLRPGLIPTATAQLQSLNPAIKDLNHSSAVLAETLDDAAPAIKSAAMSTKASGENVQQITEDWKQVSDDTNKWLHGQLNPTKPTMAHRVLMMILNTILGNGIQGAVRR